MTSSSQLLLAVLAGLSSVALSHSPAFADRYCTQISAQDKISSTGEMLKDAASIIRQDRANFYRFDKADEVDQADDTFASAEARAKIPAMVKKGKLEPAVAREIVEKTPVICAEAEEGALHIVLSSSDVFEPVAYPFTGTWSCNGSTVTLSPTLYNEGGADMPVQEVAEGTDGSYTIFLSDEKIITLSAFTEKSMTWFAPDRDETKTCERTQ